MPKIHIKQASATEQVAGGHIIVFFFVNTIYCDFIISGQALSIVNNRHL